MAKTSASTARSAWLRVNRIITEKNEKPRPFWRGFSVHGNWFQTVAVPAAYPAAALREELQGSVGVYVKIDDSGHVTQCFVRQSSSHDVLDQAVCHGMIRYAQFDPALDEDGNPTEGSYQTTITYRINENPLPDQIPLEGLGREILAAPVATA
ncbi:MAG: energy transducer TonB [Pseudomonadota bacterium]